MNLNPLKILSSLVESSIISAWNTVKSTQKLALKRTSCIYSNDIANLDLQISISGRIKNKPRKPLD